MSYYILSAVKRTSGTKDALEIMKEYYGGMLEKGATTFWEDFDVNWIAESGRKGKKIFTATTGNSAIRDSVTRFVTAGRAGR